MRDPKRIPKILKALQKIWERHPDLRLGQLLLNLGYDFYYTEDVKLIEQLEKLYIQLEKLTGGGKKK